MAFGPRAQRQTRYDRRRGAIERALQGFGQPVGIALNDPDALEAARQQFAELRLEFDQDEPFGCDSSVDQRLRDGPRSRPEFDDRAGVRGIDILRHGASQRTAGGRDGSGSEGVLEPGLDEPCLVRQPLLERSLGRSVIVLS